MSRIEFFEFESKVSVIYDSFPGTQVPCNNPIEKAQGNVLKRGGHGMILPCSNHLPLKALLKKELPDGLYSVCWNYV